MQHKVAELAGALLDAAVALAEGWRPVGNAWETPGRLASGEAIVTPEFAPWPWSSDWRYGGRIIERERISVQPWPNNWAALLYGPGRVVQGVQRGPTPLIAAMRAYVASKFGEEIEIP